MATTMSDSPFTYGAPIDISGGSFTINIPRVEYALQTRSVTLQRVHAIFDRYDGSPRRMFYEWTPLSRWIPQ